MSAVTRLEAQEWINRLTMTRRARHKGKPVTDEDQDVPVLGAATIADVAHLMSSLYRLAMREHPPLVIVNPFADLELPEIEPRPVEFYEHAEAAALYAASGEWRTLVELGMDVGLRPGELYGLHGHRVDWLRGQLAVVDVMTRQGLRQHPKSKRSHRVVPVPAGTLEGMSRLIGLAARFPGLHRAGRRPGDRWALPRPGLVRGSGRSGYPAFPAPDHAAHCRLLAGSGRRAALRRPGPSGARGLRDHPAVRAPGARRTQQGPGILVAPS